MSTAAFAVLLRREKLILVCGLCAISALAWAYLLQMAAHMPAMGGHMLVMPEWTPGYFLMMLMMWVIMMVAMMLPSVLPVVLLFAGVARQSGPAGYPVLRTYLFAGGYLLSWSLFSLAATLLQWGLDSAALLSAQMATVNPWLGTSVLLAAGIYQWTPAKDACLEQCRGPVDYLSRHWRKGAVGALRMGFGHGLFCIGCCWILMALLFVGGVMSLLVIALITLLVLAEKLVPAGVRIERYTGATLVLAGLLWLLTSAGGGAV